MPLVGDLALPEFDHADPLLSGDRFREVTENLRRESWVARTDFGYVVLDREGAEFFLRSRTVAFSGEVMALMFGATTERRHGDIARLILALDGPEHARMRRLLNPSFGPRAVEHHRPMIRRHLAEVWADVPAEGPVDAVHALCRPFPTRVVASLLGTSAQQARRLHDSALLVHRQFLSDPLDEGARIDEAAAEIRRTVRELLDDAAAAPRDDLLSLFAAAHAEEGGFSFEDCVVLVLNVLIGGVETIEAEFGHALRLFSEHPEEWDALRADPETIPQAVEEVFRFEPSAPLVPRIVVEDTEHRGVVFPAGTLLFVALSTANRDAPDAGPLEFAPRCPRETKPIPFGVGPHHCLGASLARAELQEAIAFLAERVTRLEPAGTPRFTPAAGVYGLRRLPLVLHRA